MNLHVHGDSIGSLSEYYLRKIIDIKEKIDEKGEELANRDIEELTDFFIQDVVLPTIEKDASRSRTMKKEENINSAKTFPAKLKISGIDFLLLII